MKILYRCERGYRSEVYFYEYTVLRETPKCYVIKDPYSTNDKFVLKEAKKRFAYDSKGKALIGFIKRTERCIDYINSSKERAKNYLQTAKELYERHTD